ncbi:MAG: hypothetical protein KAI43_06185 [Candidatus Aureabacteria bacterium]|nr:hypothetical protein [Candidatus Auribacterota bacterium]
MKAYKFRPSSQLAFALDIIFNKRLHCADWQTLNDPMEGMFAYSYSSSSEKDHSHQVEAIIREKKQIKICSLSKTFDSHLLWSHYASGFDGLVVEVELPDRDERVKDVIYRGIFAQVSMEEYQNASDTAETILSSKYNEWEYEKEIRVLNRSEWYSLRKSVTKIIIGHRMSPALVEALKIICDKKNICLTKSTITDDGIMDFPI